MIKKLFSLAIIVVMFAACGNVDKENNDKQADAKMEVVSATFASLIENPTEYLDKNISLDGKVIHVCEHSGKKMFIVGEDPDIRLVVTAGEEVPEFSMELLGSEITVTGLLAKVEAGVEKKHEEKAEGEHAEGDHDQGDAEGDHEHGDAEGDHEHGDDTEESEELCETEAAVEAQVALKEFVLQYKKHTVK